MARWQSLKRLSRTSSDRFTWRLCWKTTRGRTWGFCGSRAIASSTASRRLNHWQNLRQRKNHAHNQLDKPAVPSGLIKAYCSTLDWRRKETGRSRHAPAACLQGLPTIKPRLGRIVAVEGCMNPRILIAGIGNIFLGDDAFGVEVVRALAQRQLPPEVEVIDFGIRSYDLALALSGGYEVVV